MRKALSYILGFGAMLFSLTSCFENPSWTYEGPTVAEFSNPRRGFATQPTNNVANGIRTRTIRQGIGRDSILVQLVGAQRPVATTINYSIDPTSTAVEGTHYQIVGTKGPGHHSAKQQRRLPGCPVPAWYSGFRSDHADGYAGHNTGYLNGHQSKRKLQNVYVYGS